MATVDKDSNRKGQSEAADSVPLFLRYPEDQIDFGYEIATSGVIGSRHSRGPEGLSLVARVYE